MSKPFGGWPKQSHGTVQRPPSKNEQIRRARQVAEQMSLSRSQFIRALIAVCINNGEEGVLKIPYSTYTLIDEDDDLEVVHDEENRCLVLRYKPAPDPGNQGRSETGTESSKGE